MQAVVTLKITGLDDAQRLLGRSIGAMLQPALRNAAIRIEGEMKKYPNPSPGVLLRRGTPAQRRAFFAKRRENGGDWARTGLLGRSWTWRLTSGVSGDYGAIVYNPVEYAHWVQSRQYQANIHRGIWQTDQDVLERESGFIIREIESALRNGFT